jgi:SAM-dependent methyltransferase
MDAHDWDDRYGKTDLMWSQGPNQWIEEVTSELVPGRALDLAAGEGRNAIWLAGRGWQATALDFSAVALERAAHLAEERLGAYAGRFSTQCEDLSTYSPARQSADLVIVVYLQVAAPMRTRVLRAAADAVASGGTLVVAAHDTDNLTHGHGGPQDPAVLYSAADVVADVDGSGLSVTRAERVARTVVTPEGERQALDCLVVATRPLS